MAIALLAQLEFRATTAALHLLHFPVLIILHSFQRDANKAYHILHLEVLGGGLVSVFAFPAITLYVCICVSSNPLELSNRTLVTAKLQSQPLLEENLHILSLTSLKRKSPKTQILYLTD